MASAVFIAMVAAPAALYGVGYSAAYAGRYSLRWLGAMLNLFLLATSLVPLADNVVTFLLAWEAMSVASYFLVLTDRDEPETVGAANWYLGMTQVGLAFLLGSFLLLGAAAPTLDFVDLRGAAASLPEAARGVVFALALVGFGSKAGLIPLHVWLPRAHPAAPSHVSALLSGVMIKLGIYGLLRVGLDLLGGGPAWWGVVLIVLGAGSAVLGVLYALMEDDIKRLLAYSSVENMGIITLGVGAAFLFQSLAMERAAMLALAAALYHALNHAAFKGLLFLGAGSVLHATGTRNMNRHGGLIKRMPWTGPCFLLGAVAIAGLPPLNGFFSEWLLFQALLPGIGVASPLVAVVMVLALGMLALTAGLAAAAFVKCFGITFLAIPRSDGAAAAHEAPVSMRAGMVALAAACAGLAAGALPVLATTGAVAAGLFGLATEPPAFRLWLTFQTPAGLARMSPPAIIAGLLGGLGVVWLVVRVLASRRPLRYAPTWGCGRVEQTPRMEYTATAFAEPLRRIFSAIYRPSEDVTMDHHPESRYFVQAIAYRASIVPWFERYLYEPALAWVRRWGWRARSVQSGSVHAYLAYVVGALVLLLGVLLVTGAP
ncbi:MAG TPA: proton-conducting transporter membrane subunit [Methylomirabilota bacterium]|nr:proton-conducting transporter membrane subunit [Methylomirabilota bacterium]